MNNALPGFIGSGSIHSAWNQPSGSSLVPHSVMQCRNKPTSWFLAR
jgi:hypothetical protein